MKLMGQTPTLKFLYTLNLFLSLSIAFLLLPPNYLVAQQITSNPNSDTAQETQTTDSFTAPDIEIVPYLVGQGTTVIFDIRETDSLQLNNIGEVYYNLNYDTDRGKRGMEGRITNLQNQIFGYYLDKPYVRREFLLGVCSKAVCIYDTNPRNFRLSIIATTLQGQKITKEFSF